MSETTSAATGRCFSIQRVCQVWERSRAARTGTPPDGRGAGATWTAAKAIGRAAAGSDSYRSRSVPVPRRRPSQGPRTASGPGWVRVARTRVLRVMRAHGLLSPRTAGGRAPRRPTTGGPSPRRPTSCGGRTACGYSHARRRVGLDLRGGRTLERGVRGVARVQSREPLRGTRSDCARARTSLWLAGCRRRPRASTSDGSRQAVPVRPLPAASRHLVSQTTKKLEQYLSRRLEEYELAALMMDGLEVAGQTVRRNSRYHNRWNEGAPGYMAGLDGELSGVHRDVAGPSRARIADR